jgi:hypothetical protein
MYTHLHGNVTFLDDTTTKRNLDKEVSHRFLKSLHICKHYLVTMTIPGDQLARNDVPKLLDFVAYQLKRPE